MNIRLATERDDAQLRSLVAEMPMPGWVRLAYEREPSYFLGLGGDGSESQVLVGEHQGRLNAVGGRSVKRVYVDGGARPFGYLHSLRISPAARNGTTLARGYRFLHELHQDGRAPAYLSAILESNRHARKIITSGRAGLPRYHDFGRYESHALPTAGRMRRPPEHLPSALDIGPRRLLQFYRQCGPQRQFFPELPDACASADECWLGLPWKHFRVLLTADGRIRGAAARWDRSENRQLRVAGYAPWLRYGRHIANAALRLTGLPGLPAAGELLPVSFATLLCTRQLEDREAGQLLISALLADAADAGDSFLIAGFHERDPLRMTTRMMRKMRYRSRLYIVAYEDGSRTLRQLRRSRKVPYLEIGTL